jgi:hypothetical protein
MQLATPVVQIARKEKMNHRGTESTEKTKTEKRHRIIPCHRFAFAFFTLFFSLAFVFSVLSVPLWFIFF